ncbi:hypothetical protein [Parathermosynechococcus lividus]
MHQGFTEQLRSFYWTPYIWNRVYDWNTTEERASIETLFEIHRESGRPAKTPFAAN